MSVPIVFLICSISGLAISGSLNHENLAMHPGNLTEHIKTILSDWLLNTTMKNKAQDALEPALDSTLSKGSIIGIAVGSVLLVLTVGLMVWCGYRQRYPGVTRKRRRRG
ncbi:hypothetical protein HD806DRAFT_525686 [Xylariaceae sp. AK1471]|nr:hypothetical protein HD806DRAFT_525686 [Xylariaceae sp. AK1471]